MKKTIGLIMVIILAVCLTVPDGVHAASAKTKIKKLVGNMEQYEYSLLSGMDLSVGEGYDIVLDSEHMAQAAALATKYLEVVEQEEDFWVIRSLSSSRIKKMSKKLFGETVSYKKLTKDEGDGFTYAYRNKKGKPLVYSWCGETEMDFVTRTISISKSGNGYIVTKAIYYGYWGQNDGSSANYSVSYKVSKSDVSSYGYVITAMNIKRFAE